MVSSARELVTISVRRSEVSWHGVAWVAGVVIVCLETRFVGSGAEVHWETSRLSRLTGSAEIVAVVVVGGCGGGGAGVLRLVTRVALPQRRQTWKP